MSRRPAASAPARPTRRALLGGLAVLPVLPALLAGRPARAQSLRVEKLAIVTQAGGRYGFDVEIADTEGARELGLMFRTEMAPDAGMLFEFGVTAMQGFWMKNTELSLDLLFIEKSGRIAHIHPRAQPHSEKTIGSTVPVWAVLELLGGTCARLGIRAGDRVEHRAFAP